MRRISLLTIVSVGLLLTACAGTGWHTYAQAPPPKNIETASGADRTICHEIEQTGTRLSQRECHTQAEWDQMGANGMNALNLDAARSMPSTDPGSSTGR